jgi:hypothetical protein
MAPPRAELGVHLAESGTGILIPLNRWPRWRGPIRPNNWGCSDAGSVVVARCTGRSPSPPTHRMKRESLEHRWRPCFCPETW